MSDDVDNCPGQANTAQVDTDGDGRGDVCDPCPADAANDADGDGVCGNVDNCATVANVSQADADHDGTGDVCDNDVDGDGVQDASEPCFCLGTPAGSAVTTSGCSTSQLCPCPAPVGRAAWAGHREYLKCVKAAVEELQKKGVLTREQGRDIVRGAFESSCGR